ncbi:MAG: ATP-dependent DNA helicase, partial [Clostridia bacterium]|nr:ATP-dependent DNA helicase [Clostridia bacterium]
AGIPYKIIGGRRFYERKEIRDAIAYLTVIDNPADNVKLRRIINEPKRGIGDTPSTRRQTSRPASAPAYMKSSATRTSTRNSPGARPSFRSSRT